MIKARVLSTNLSAKPDAPIEVNMEMLEMWVFDDTGFLSCPNTVFPDTVFIMTEEEYCDSVDENERLREEVKKLKVENTELAANNNKLRHDRSIINSDNSRLRGIVKEQSETIQKLEEENMSIKDDIRDLEEKMAQDAEVMDIHPDGTIVFKKKKVSELEKEVEKLKDELNKKQRVVDIIMDFVDGCSDLKERIDIYEKSNSED